MRTQLLVSLAVALLLTIRSIQRTRKHLVLDVWATNLPTSRHRAMGPCPLVCDLTQGATFPWEGNTSTCLGIIVVAEGPGIGRPDEVRPGTEQLEVSVQDIASVCPHINHLSVYGKAPGNGCEALVVNHDMGCCAVGAGPSKHLGRRVVEQRVRGSISHVDGAIRSPHAEHRCPTAAKGLD